MTVLLFLFCLVAVGSTATLCYTDIRYYYVPDSVVHTAFLSLSFIGGCCGVFGSPAYIVYALGSAVLLGGAFLFLRSMAQLLERAARAKNTSRCQTGGDRLGKPTYALGLGDVKAAVLVGFIVGFAVAWKSSFNVSNAAYNGLGRLSLLGSCLYLLIALTFVNAVLWAAARGLGRRNKKIPLVPCMALALLALFFSIVMP